MIALAPILIGIAAKVGAPVVADILRKSVGGKMGELSATIIETIAGHAGTTVEGLPEMAGNNPGALEAAIVATERDTPELMLAYVESQKLANELQLAEMKGESTWTWAWRPAWMWLLAVLWSYAFVLRPVVNAAFGANIEAIDVGTLFMLTGSYLGLYLGGHTAKEIFASRK